MIRVVACLALAALCTAGPTRSQPTVLPQNVTTAMNEEPPATDFPLLRNVTLLVNGQPLVITRTDAEQIANALQRYVGAHESTADGVVLPRVAGRPWVDSRDTLRVGAWMVEARGEELVLTLRQPPSPGTASGYQFTGSLIHAESGWHVPSVGLSKLTY